MLVGAMLNRVLIVRCVSSLFYPLWRVCHVFGPCFAPFVQPSDTPWRHSTLRSCILISWYLCLVHLFAGKSG